MASPRMTILALGAGEPFTPPPPQQQQQQKLLQRSSIFSFFACNFFENRGDQEV
jgi:hypothetical protein